MAIQSKVPLTDSETQAAPPVTKSDPFADLSKLRLSQSFAETVGVKKLLTTVPARKPSDQDFTRVHPDPAYRDNFALIELRDDRELYLIAPEMGGELANECAPYTLFTAINRQGVIRIWPIRLPGPDGRTNEWWRSAREAAEMAMTRWVRLKANMSLGAYELFTAEKTIAEPAWPDPMPPFNELLRTAFRDRYVDSVDHPLVKRLRGLA
jgi:hypothetical protein